MQEKIDSYFLSDEEKIVKVISEHGGTINICLPKREEQAQSFFGMSFEKLEDLRRQIFKSGIERLLRPKSLQTREVYHGNHTDMRFRIRLVKVSRSKPMEVCVV